jgi:hypothetical protein
MGHAAGIRTSALLLVLAAAVLLVLAGAASAGGEPRRDFRAADLARAQSIRLKLSDFPSGYQAYPEDQSLPLSSGLQCTGIPDESDLTLTGKAVLPFLSSPGSGAAEDFSSGAYVFLTSVQARAAFERQMQPSLERCVTRAMIAWFRRGTYTKATLISQSLKPLAGLGVQATALRLRFRASAIRMSIAVDLFVLHEGRVEAWLVSDTLSKAVPRNHAALEESLLSKLSARLLH